MARAGSQGVAIAGGGITGLTLAVAIKRASDVDVQIFDPRIASERAVGRASAIAAGPRRMFEALGIWKAVAPHAQPINSMIITDSNVRDAVRPVYLQFGGEISPGEPFAHMVEDHFLVNELTRAAREAGVGLVPTSIERAELAGAAIHVHTAGQAALPVGLLVAADGAKSLIRRQSGLSTSGWAYRQAGVVATLAHENPHEGRAEEHFLPEGPFAVLPLVGNRISIVWTCSVAEADKTAALSAPEFVAEIESRIGYRLGELTLLDQPRAFPLGLQLARELVAARVALIGDAAHIIHPIAGQGLNLGLRDAAALAEAVCGQAQLGLDVGAPDMLEGYQRARRFDTLTMAATTDALSRLFGNDITPVRMARDFGLGLVERMPGLKRFFIEEAGGVSRQSGRLLQGLWP